MKPLAGLLASTALSDTGNAIVAVAVPWLVLERPVAALVIQHRTPERMRGRVIGSSTSLAVAAGPLGLLALGPVVDTGGPSAGYLVIGVGCLLAAAFALTGRAALGRSEPEPARPAT